MQQDQPPMQLTFNNGLKMPIVGLGTYDIKEQNFENVILDAIKVGYRLFDTAKIYKNEDLLGKAIKKAIEQKLVTREELFITTKIWQDDKENCEAALKASLSRLQLDYVDLYLIHWPIGYNNEQGKLIQYPLYKTWAQMEELVTKKLTRSIGVSNFNVQLLLDLLSYAKIPPVINQIELHPYCSQVGLVDTCRKFGVEIQGFASFGRQLNNVLADPIIQELAKKYQKSEGQIILNWLWERRTGLIPKSENVNRLKQNLEFNTFRLQQNDSQKIYDLNKNMKMNANSDLWGFNLFD